MSRERDILFVPKMTIPPVTIEAGETIEWRPSPDGRLVLIELRTKNGGASVNVKPALFAATDGGAAAMREIVAQLRAMRKAAK